MRVLTLVLVTCVSIGAAAAPTYEVTKVAGDHPFLFSFRQAASAALTAPRDNALSEWRKLPFSWKFFGRDVTGYFVSDNGYLTFDSAATESLSKVVSLADPGTPKNSILAYWSDLRFEGGQNQWTNSVWTATLGDAPSRVHVIYWMSVTAGAAPSPSALSFLVALHENGEFEIVYTAARKSGATAGLAGAVNADGSARVAAAGPAFDFPTVGFGGDDDVGYRFKPIEK